MQLTTQRIRITIERGTSLSAAILDVVSTSKLDLALLENHKLSIMSIIKWVPKGLVLSKVCFYDEGLIRDTPILNSMSITPYMNLDCVSNHFISSLI